LFAHSFVYKRQAAFATAQYAALIFPNGSDWRKDAESLKGRRNKIDKGTVGR
jgi:hypothetical protein